VQRYSQNVVVLILGVLVAAVGVLPVSSGGVFRNGAPAVVAVFLVTKGLSLLQCHISDVVLSSVALVFVVLSKVVPAQVVTPIAFHVAALAVLPVFAVTGLTFKTIAAERRKKKESGQK
jgi:hypothetical protein